MIDNCDYIVTVKELADRLHVSQQSIRNYINELKDNGKLTDTDYKMVDYGKKNSGKLKLTVTGAQIVSDFYKNKNDNYRLNHYFKGNYGKSIQQKLRGKKYGNVSDILYVYQKDFNLIKTRLSQLAKKFNINSDNEILSSINQIIDEDLGRIDKL